MLNFRLPENWKWVTIEDVQSEEKRATITGPFGSSIGSKFFVERGIPVIRGNNLTLKSEKFIDNGFVFITKEKAEELKGYKAIANDLLFTAAGTIGQVGIIPKDCAYDFYIISNKQMRVRFNTDLVDPEFAYYWFSSAPMVAYIKSHDTGSTIPLINLGILRKLPMPLPPLNEQIFIRKQLAILDKKIHLNTQTNQTLESIAQAIFKSWFVDFEPVKAKMTALAEGGTREQAELAAMGAISGKSEAELAQLQQQNPEHYQQLAETAALFPSAMVESELGEIPEGWEVFELNYLANLNEKSWTAKNAPSQISYVDLANTKWGVINSIESYEYNDAPSRARRILRKNDTIIGTVRPGNGSFSFIKTDNLTGSTGFAVLSPKEEIFSELIYIAATSPENIERLAHLADGGAYPAVRPEIVMETCVTLPALEETRLKISSVFHTYTASFFDAINGNQVENAFLAELRDSLLPKLLSGEIDLSDIQSEVA